MENPPDHSYPPCPASLGEVFYFIWWSLFLRLYFSKAALIHPPTHLSDRSASGAYLCQMPYCLYRVSGNGYHRLIAQRAYDFIEKRTCSRPPLWISSKEPVCQCRRHGFDPWVGKIPWRRKWQPIPVFLSGQSFGQMSLADYSPSVHNRVGYDWVTKQQQYKQQSRVAFPLKGYLCFFFHLKSSTLFLLSLIPNSQKRRAILWLQMSMLYRENRCNQMRTPQRPAPDPSSTCVGNHTLHHPSILALT